MEERDYWKWKILDLAYEIGQSDHPEDLIETLGNNDDKELYFKLVNEGL